MYNTITLDSGLRIIHRSSDSPIVYCGYQVAAGSRDEEPGQEGLAHFCEHLSFKGTESRSSLQIINCLESVGGELNAFTNKDATVYYSAIQKEHLPKAVRLLTDIVFRSTYPQQEINKEVEVICEEIESYNDSPAELIYDEFENMIFSGHPLGHNILGTQENVRRFTTADAVAFTGKHYVPENAIFFCYGDVDFDRLCHMLRKEDLRPTGGVTPPMRNKADMDNIQMSLPPIEGCAPQTIVKDLGTHQAHVMMGCQSYCVHDKRRLALYLLNNILGGPAMNARLNLALRERNGLVYTVESSMVSYGDTGIWTVYFGCDQKDIHRCMRLVRRELDRLAQQPLTESRLKAAKRQIKGQIALACDNRESFAIDFGKSFLHYDWEKDITSLYRNIESLTASQLQDVAKEVFDERRISTLIYK